MRDRKNAPNAQGCQEQLKMSADISYNNSLQVIEQQKTNMK